MKLVWKNKNEEKTITKAVINGKIYLIKDVVNVKVNGKLEKVLEIGQEVLK